MDCETKGFIKRMAVAQERQANAQEKMAAFRGGQGRSDEEIERAGGGVFIWLAAAALTAFWIVIYQLAS